MKFLSADTQLKPTLSPKKVRCQCKKDIMLPTRGEYKKLNIKCANCGLILEISKEEVEKLE